MVGLHFSILLLDTVIAIKQNGREVGVRLARNWFWATWVVGLVGSAAMVVKLQQQRVETQAANLAPETQAAIVELAVARDYARNVPCDPWQFAVEISRLTALGLTVSDLRWLVEKRYVAHACEVTQPDDLVRKFAPARNTAFTKETCCLLTDSGLFFAGVADASPRLLRLADRSAAMPPEAAAAPRWDERDRILYLGEQCVKRYGRPSPNQEIILVTFEEEGWPRHIDDPLPPSGDIVPKSRLHDTIKWLNRGQENRLMNFMGDGSGEGVYWEIVAAAALDIPASLPKRLRFAA